MNTHKTFRLDTSLLVVTAVLLGLSILMVFSTTALFSEETFGNATTLVKKHLIQIFLGLLLLGAFSQLDPRRFYKIAPYLLVISVISLLLVLIPGIGHVAGGARRWLVAGPLRVQPGEVAKLAVALYMASYIGRHHDRMLEFVPGALIPLGIVGVFASLLLLQPDFGSTVIILCIVFVQLVTVSRMLHLLGIGVGALCMMGVLIVLSPYRFKRFESFLNPFSDASASGYQLVQSLIAVGSGGLTGEGLGAGKQKLFYLPAAHTDFIFAVISEELGLLGAIGLVILFLLFAWCGLSIARRLSREPYLCALAAGLTTLIVVPAFLNMGVVLGLLPTKGLVLPLVAYGGTAMVVNLAVVGVLLRLSKMSS